MLHRDRPQMVNLHRVSSEFSICRMRDSVMRQFVDQDGSSGDSDDSMEADAGDNTVT